MGKGTSRLIVVGVIAVLGGAGCPSQRVQNGHLTSLAQFGNSV